MKKNLCLIRRGRSFAAAALSLVMAASLVACSNQSGSGGAAGTSAAQSGTQAAGQAAQSGGGNEAAGTAAPEWPVGKNEDNSFSIITSWTQTGLINHFDSQTSCGMFVNIVVEGLWGYVRSTDEVYCRLASELPVHTTENMDAYKDVMGEDLYSYLKDNGYSSVTVTTGTIRPEAKWHNGDPFKAKDVWSYYYLLRPQSTNYLLGVKIVDDRTVQFIWNPLKEPQETVKNLLLAQDACGTVKYEEFDKFVDATYDLVMAGTVNEDASKWAAFGRVNTDEQNEEINVIRTDFQLCDPSWYVATGPFKLDTFSETQILLVKNEDHWAADKIGFDKVKLYTSGSIDQSIQMLLDGTVDMGSGYTPDTLKQILAQNEDLVCVRVVDTGCVGLSFNTSNPLLADRKVREALQYVFDREGITKAWNPSCLTSPYPELAMPLYQAQRYMSPEHLDSLPKYSYDPDKAAQLLEEAGWEKKGASWYANGAPVEFTMGSANGNLMSLPAESATAQLEAFGIKCNLLISDNYIPLATAEDSPYDMTCHWSDLNVSFSYPFGSFSQFATFTSYVHHLERDENGLTLTFDGLDGDTEKYKLEDYYQNFYYMEPDELTYMVDVTVHGVAKECLGVQFFNQVACNVWNVAKVSGLPLKDHWMQDRDCTYVPDANSDEFLQIQRTNMDYSKEFLFTEGIFQPNKAE